MTTKLKVLLFAAFLLSTGCDYIPRETYEIETKAGVTLLLSCPTIDRERNRFTYIYAGDCIVVKE